MERLVAGKIGGDDVFGEVGVGGGQVPAVFANDTFEGPDFLKLLDLRAVETSSPEEARLIRQPKLHNAVRPLVRERVHYHRVDHAEDGGGGSDPEGQREDCGKGETWPLAKFTSRIAEVGQHGVHQFPVGRAPPF
jgi:hypothetical protein